MIQKLVLVATIIGLSSFFAGPTRSQWVETNDSLGGIACFAPNGSSLVAGTQTGGVFRLAEQNGNLIANRLYTNSGGNDIASIAAMGNCLFAGIATADVTGNIARSTDNGVTWTFGTNPPSGMALALAVIGTKLFVGQSLITTGSVYLSTDSGSSWTIASTGMGYVPVQCLCSNWSSLFAGTAQGIFVTTNDGASWTASSEGLTNQNVLALESVGNDLFAGTYGGGVFRSVDFGKTWSPVNTGLTDTSVTSFATINNNLFAGTTNGIFLTTNNGASWAAVSSGITSPYIYAISEFDTDLFAGTGDPGVWHRPLSQMIEGDGISESPVSSPQVQAYPNPVFGTTRISVASGMDAFSDVSVYNLLGQEVTPLFHGELTAGQHSFTWDANSVAPGSYWCITWIAGHMNRIALSVQR